METTCQRHIIQGHFKTPPVLKKDYFIYSLHPCVYFCCRSQPQRSYSAPAQPTELPFLFEPPSPLQPQSCGSCLLWGKAPGIVHIPALADLKVQLWKVSRSTWRKGDWEAPSSGWQSPAGEGHVGHTLLPSKGRKSLTEPRLEESGSSSLRVFTARALGQHHVQVCLNKACCSLCTTAWVQLHRSSDAPQRFHLPFVVSES